MFLLCHVFTEEKDSTIYVRLLYLYYVPMAGPKHPIFHMTVNDKSLSMLYKNFNCTA